MYDAGTAEGWKSCVAQAAKDFVPAVPLDIPLRLTLVFYIGRPKSHRRTNGELKPNAPTWLTGKPDADNLRQGGHGRAHGDRHVEGRLAGGEAYGGEGLRQRPAWVRRDHRGHELGARRSRSIFGTPVWWQTFYEQNEANIEWARSTASPWLLCTEVSLGCGHCYARELAAFKYEAMIRAAYMKAGYPELENDAALGRQGAPHYHQGHVA